MRICMRTVDHRLHAWLSIGDAFIYIYMWIATLRLNREIRAVDASGARQIYISALSLISCLALNDLGTYQNLESKR